MRWKWFGVGCALALFGLQAGAQTVDEIIAKNIAARGGLDKIENLLAQSEFGSPTRRSGEFLGRAEPSDSGNRKGARSADPSYR